MLVLGSRLHDTPIMSLQTGTRLATISAPIVNPANLKVMAYVVDGPLLNEHPSFLRTADIRELGALGMIIDSADEFVGEEDVIKLKELRELDFNLIGMTVIDETKHKLGKVEDFTLETKGFVIQQLTVRRGFLRSLSDTGLLINRSQIIEINDNAVIVKTTAKKASVQPIMETARREYVNPFRGTSPQTEQQRD